MEVTRLRRFLTAWLTAALLVGLAISPVSAKGPKCADIQSTSADGNTPSSAAWDGTTGEVNGRFFLGAASCKNITYTLVILDDEGGTVLATESVIGDGSNPLIIQIAGGVADPDGDVCAFITANQRNRTLDVAPADGCVILLDDGTSPGGGKGF